MHQKSHLALPSLFSLWVCSHCIQNLVYRTTEPVPCQQNHRTKTTKPEPRVTVYSTAPVSASASHCQYGRETSSENCTPSTSISEGRPCNPGSLHATAPGRALWGYHGTRSRRSILYGQRSNFKHRVWERITFKEISWKYAKDNPNFFSIFNCEICWTIFWFFMGE